MAVRRESFSESQAFTARIPNRLYESLRKIAADRGVSMNRLVQDALATLEKSERENRIRDGFRKLASKDVDSDVTFATGRQAEVALGD